MAEGSIYGHGPLPDLNPAAWQTLADALLDVFPQAGVASAFANIPIGDAMAISYPHEDYTRAVDVMQVLRRLFPETFRSVFDVSTHTDFIPPGELAFDLPLNNTTDPESFGIAQARRFQDLLYDPNDPWSARVMSLSGANPVIPYRLSPNHPAYSGAGPIRLATSLYGTTLGDLLDTAEDVSSLGVLQRALLSGNPDVELATRNYLAGANEDFGALNAPYATVPSDEALFYPSSQFRSLLDTHTTFEPGHDPRSPEYPLPMPEDRLPPPKSIGYLDDPENFSRIMPATEKAGKLLNTIRKHGFLPSTIAGGLLAEQLLGVFGKKRKQARESA